MKQQILLSVCNILPGKSLRRSMREKVRQMLVKSAKIGVSYSVWDGEELLEASIKTIRSQVDYVNVVWQKKSWYGKPCDAGLEPLLNNLKEQRLVDELIFFEPDLNKLAPLNECTKRNLGLRHAKKAGCTHFMTMDTDEFYITSEFAAAKQFVLENDLTHTACNIYNYADETHRQIGRCGFFVPFLYKIGPFSKLSRNCFGKKFWFVDPTKQMTYNLFSRFCFLHNVDQHHFSTLRRDIRKKYANSATVLNEKQTEAILKELSKDNPQMVKVDNIFNIKI